MHLNITPKVLRFFFPEQIHLCVQLISIKTPWLISPIPPLSSSTMVPPKGSTRHSKKTNVLANRHQDTSAWWPLYLPSAHPNWQMQQCLLSPLWCKQGTSLPHQWYQQMILSAPHCSPLCLHQQLATTTTMIHNMTNHRPFFPHLPHSPRLQMMEE